ncbi:molybdate ABC transporter substrate-binding protein [Leucothrix sargassi]|nr:molybdate ABC transporter substrate-binding protein [Leucothrix sargassi]
MTNFSKKCVNYSQNCVKHTQRAALLFVALSFSVPSLYAAEVTVAVASNFIKPMKALAKRFEEETGHQAKLAFGSSGKLFAQISHGAPFDVFLSADKDKVTRLLAKGTALSGSEFVYATGRLALWSSNPTLVDEKGGVLKQGGFKYVAVANPKLAPYGAAAQSVLQTLELDEMLSPKKVIGENIAQTFQFVQTGNAELGFVAWSQVKGLAEDKQGSYWLVPSACHPAIEQYAVTLKSAENNVAASALSAFLQQESSRALIQSFGYD